MARLNIDEKLFADARFVALCNKVSRREAIGMMIDAWFLAQKHWLKDHKYIPENEFFMAGLEPLVGCLFAQKIDDSYYIKGSESQFEWLKKRQEDGKKGGIKSAESRLKKYGTASILRSTNEAPLHVPFVNPSCEMNPLTLTPTLTPTLTLTQKINKNTNSNTISVASGTATNVKTLIAFYCEKYKQRFGVNPVITGKESGAVKNILKAMSLERAQEIITDYFELSDAWIVQRMYALSILQDASVINRIQAKRQGIDVTRQRSIEFEKQSDAQKLIDKMFSEDHK